MLLTIDLYVTDEWFIAYKRIVYIVYSYRLHRLNLWFMFSVCLFSVKHEFYRFLEDLPFFMLIRSLSTI